MPFSRSIKHDTIIKFFLELIEKKNLNLINRYRDKDIKGIERTETFISLEESLDRNVVVTSEV